MRRKFVIGLVLGIAVTAVVMWMRSALNDSFVDEVLSEPTEETKATVS